MHIQNSDFLDRIMDRSLQLPSQWLHDLRRNALNLLWYAVYTVWLLKRYAAYTVWLLKRYVAYTVWLLKR